MTVQERPLRFGLIGCGFWAQTQLNAWQEIEDVKLAAVCDIDAAKAEQTAKTFSAPRFYTNAEEMLAKERFWETPAFLRRNKEEEKK